MTSTINFEAINTAYPVPGVDNDSQGFRDNFTAIATALATAKTELSALQTKSVLVASLSSNTPVVNNLLGSTISNGVYSAFSGSTNVSNAGADVTFISINRGPLQIITLKVNTAPLTFRDWPTSGLYSKVRIHLVGSANSAKTPELYTQGGQISYPSDFPSLEVGGAKITVTSSSSTGLQADELSVSDLVVNRQIIFDSSIGGIVEGSIYYVKEIVSDASAKETKFTISATRSDGIAGPEVVLSVETKSVNGTQVISNEKVIDAWTYNNGGNVFVEFIGEY
jgi:hypothetical protein